EATARELFTGKTDSVRRGLATWYWVCPHAALFAALMLGLALSVHFWLATATILLALLCWWLVALLRGRARNTSAMIAGRAESVLSLLVDRLRHNRLPDRWASARACNGESVDELRRYSALVVRHGTA